LFDNNNNQGGSGNEREEFLMKMYKELSDPLRSYILYIVTKSFKIPVRNINILMAAQIKIINSFETYS